MNPTPAESPSLERTQKYREFAELDIWRQSIQRRLSRHETLKDEINAWHADEKVLAAGSETAVRVGTYEIQIGAKGNQKRWVSMRKVYAAAGTLTSFLKIATVTFKALSEQIGTEKAEALQLEERTGSRRVKAVIVMPMPAAPAELPKAA
jgi:hypothetical protein